MNLRSFRSARPAQRLAALSVGIVGLCAAVALYTTNANAASRPSHAPRFSAVQLANGIIFADGPAATRAVGHRATLTSRQKMLESKLDTLIQSQPAAASKAAAQLQSGNRLAVRAGLTYVGNAYKTVLDNVDGAQNVLSAVNSLATRDGITAPPDDSTESATPDILLWTYSTTVTDEYSVSYAAVDLALAGAALLALALVLVVVFPFASPKGTLAADELVNKLAVNLAV